MEKGSRIDAVANRILRDSGQQADKMDMSNKPDKAIVQTLVHSLTKIVMPGYAQEKEALSSLMENVFYHLHRQIGLALLFDRQSQGKLTDGTEDEAEEICLRFFERLPQVAEYVQTDMQAAFDGDPAAGSKEEILLAYPGLLASTVNRLAHELYLLGVPLVPRMMTEYAHSLTGIDIHPGATLGRYFFIDHGKTLKNLKRHPTIEDNVTIYSGASILGGNTVIGHDSVIGGNVFITKSVPANTRVSVKNQELISRTTTGKGLQRQELTQNDVWYYVI
jgi:serine O-acetyltransferase